MCCHSKMSTKKRENVLLQKYFFFPHFLMSHLSYLRKLFAHLGILQNHFDSSEWTTMLMQKSSTMEHTVTVWHWCIAAFPEDTLWSSISVCGKCYDVNTGIIYNTNLNKWWNCYSVYTIENFSFNKFVMLLMFYCFHKDVSKLRAFTLVLSSHSEARRFSDTIYIIYGHWCS